MKSYLLLFTCVLTGVLGQASHAALITNGSFEDGGGSFNGWSVAGAAVISTNQYGAPPDGASQAFISTSVGSASGSALSTFFGTALPGNTRGGATEGSGIKHLVPKLFRLVRGSVDFETVLACISGPRDYRPNAVHHTFSEVIILNL